jgi:hypothetical protein
MLLLRLLAVFGKILQKESILRIVYTKQIGANLREQREWTSPIPTPPSSLLPTSVSAFIHSRNKSTWFHVPSCFPFTPGSHKAVFSFINPTIYMVRGYHVNCPSIFLAYTFHCRKWIPVMSIDWFDSTFRGQGYSLFRVVNRSWFTFATALYKSQAVIWIFDI